MADQQVEAVYQLHQSLLNRVQAGNVDDDVLSAAQSTLEQMRQTGARVGSISERDYLQSLLSFWGNWLFNQTGVYPNTSLYPASPDALTQAQAATMVEIAVPHLPIAEQTFFAVSSQVASGTGQPFILASVISPANGGTVQRGADMPLSGMYANLQAAWRLFFVMQAGEESAMSVLDEGYAPVAPSGVWNAVQRWTASASPLGIYYVGLALAITPEAISTLQTAYRSGTPLAEAPVGSILFGRLSVVRIS
jgi:hypothetical protein